MIETSTMPACRRDAAVRSGSRAIEAAASGLALLIALAAAPAGAQTSLNPSARVSTPLGVALPASVTAVPPLPAPEALFGDMFGTGELRKAGIDLLLDDTNEFSGIVSGPRKGSTNAGQYAFETDIDWQRLAGLSGFSTHSVVVGRYGIPASRIFGDNLNPSQEIYGAGGNVAVHLVYAYGEETLAGGRFDITAGRIPFLNDFSASPLYCNFMNNSFCGNPKASSDNTAHSSYPDGGWATRVRVRPTKSTYIQTGIFFTEANIYSATNGFRSGFRFSSAQINGEAFPVEVGYEPMFGPDKLPGHYKLGFAYDNQNHKDGFFDVNGSALGQTGLPPRQRKGTTAAWVLVDQMLLRNGPGNTNGLIVLGGFYHNDPSTSTRNDQYEVALLDQGFWKARPKDLVGVAFNYLQVSNALTRTEELQQELGLPITGNGGQFYNDSTPGIQSHTMDIEATYQIHVMRGVTFAPDFQYFIRPNAQTNLHDAALLGFKTHIELF
ncbi:carbohydrate porin [Lichenicola cladoniae]|uniref:Carbohydrate porin n=1 Tax=Lichenicola cladoniae TaxID=1484109 RepID=A0A6M8HTH7_9PROT|nr:carbohydrate porin [Lichenicola cladoniae]NPD67742.1 carbohydrate porin [Acetobacteraceae bacterium]QKE91668.1 carbohydrate porin [Lichenicola cladoniae]